MAGAPSFEWTISQLWQKTWMSSALDSLRYNCEKKCKCD